MDLPTLAGSCRQDNLQNQQTLAILAQCKNKFYKILKYKIKIILQHHSNKL